VADEFEVHYALPEDGGCTLWIRGEEAGLPVVETCYEVDARIQTAERWGHRWMIFTTLADASNELPRRPVFIEPGLVVGMTYLEPEFVEKLEHEI
jgi:hypothetical protein